MAATSHVVVRGTCVRTCVYVCVRACVRVYVCVCKRAESVFAFVTLNAHAMLLQAVSYQQNPHLLDAYIIVRCHCWDAACKARKCSVNNCESGIEHLLPG
jgi:hypothetical protein